MRPALRCSLALLTSALLLCAPAIAYDTPLSEQAVREAYFLRQRRDESMYGYLNKYTKLLPPPKTGPHISAVSFLTPFALLVQYSSRQSDYSAQRAALRITQFDLLFKYFYKSFALSGIEARSWAAIGAIYRGALSRARTTTCGSEFCHGSSERRVALLTSAIGTQQKPKSRSLTPRRFFFDGARGFGMIGLDR